MPNLKISGIKNFIVPEFVPREIWKSFNIKAIRFLSPGLMHVAQKLRDYFDRPIEINNWYFRSSYSKNVNQWRGFRTPNCNVGSKLSRHKLGLCLDLNIKGILPKELQEDIRINYKPYKAMGITAIEADTPTWTHISMENTLQDDLWVIPNPNKKDG